ncbi:Dos2-interacting transcription regulator of RNA-Pol-II-domain-containing protein [Crassisporium funariophilum]|nr:Dos2-interacting transcription regulator of RNA-Pol-II-domain-containing protein [Crassisporium funariophilum]
MWGFFFTFQLIGINKTKFTKVIANLSIEGTGIVVPFVGRLLRILVFTRFCMEWGAVREHPGSNWTTRLRGQQTSGRMSAQQYHVPARAFNISAEKELTEEIERVKHVEFVQVVVLLGRWSPTGFEADISNDRTSLIIVVKALGEYLTSEDNDLRRKVLAQSPPEKLNRQSVRVLTTFYCEKLEDSETVKPALSGILTLVSLPSFSPPEATAVIEGLFQHVRMKAIVQAVRFLVFSIVDSLMAFHRNVLKAMGKHFVGGYISLAEGEKDPRNLMVAFAIARVILIEFDVSEHVESMFNIIFCYFPITFRPPPNDPYGISTDDLRLALRNCLNATPAFGPLAVPVFLEKLTAGSRSTKKDTLQALAACLPVYGSALARASARKLWNSLKLEIFQPMDQHTEEEALTATQILVKTIYTDEEAAVESNEDIHGLARDACEECVRILKEPEKSQAKPATKVLCAFMSTTPSVSRYTISQAVPHLVRLFLNPDEISTRGPTLVLLSELTTAARDAKADDKASPSEGIPALMPYKDEVLGVFVVGLGISSARSAGLSGLKAMASTKNLLSDEELGFIVHNVDQIVEGNQEEWDDSSDAILELLTTISTVTPRHVADQTLPLLFRSLPETAPSREAVDDRAKCWRTLSALQTLCVQAELFENLVIRLTTKLDLICLPSEQSLSAPDNMEPNAAYAHSLLKTLAQTLATKVEKKDPDVVKYIDRLTPRIFNLFIASAFLSAQHPMIATEPRLLQVAGEIINLVVQSLPLHKQQSYSVGLSKAIMDGDMSDIAQGFQKISNGRKFSIFNESSTPVHRNLLVLLTAAVIALRKEVHLDLGNLTQFLDMLLDWVLMTADNDLQRLSALHVVSSIVNRRVDELSSFLNDKLDNYWSQKICDKNLPIERRIWAIKSWTWISKALLVRKHPLAMPFAERLYEAFGDDTISWEAAKAVGEIPSPDTVLTKANHAELKVLYVQRYVNAVLPRIMASAKDGSNPVKQTAYLVAVTSLIKSIPRASFIHEMPSLIPLLLRGLDLPDVNIRSHVIDTFLTAAEGETPEKSLVSEHSATLVNSMLKNSKLAEMASTRVRISALKYLAVLPDIVRYDVLHPYKPTVLRDLAEVLDDPKRSVRKEAVDAR